MKVTHRQLRRIIREQVRATPVVFDEGRFGYTIDGRPVRDEELGYEGGEPSRGFAVAWEDGDVRTAAEHLKEMGVTHMGGDMALDTIEGLGLEPSATVTLEDWLRYRSNSR